MDLSLIDGILPSVEKFIGEKTELLAFPDKGFTPLTLDKNNFFQLELFQTTNLFVAIDGGSATLLESPSFSLFVIRTVAVYYKNTKRMKTTKKEFFCFVTSTIKDEKIVYTTKIVGDSHFKTSPSFDKETTLLDGTLSNLDVSSVGNLVRRYSELLLAAEIAKEEKMHIVIDGTLKAIYSEELLLIKKLILSLSQSNSTVGFLSKTSRMLTKNAHSLTTSLQELGPKSTWYYYPIFSIQDENYLGDMYFCKLHTKSHYVFKLEMAKESKHIKDFILSLSTQAQDPIFYGYPYALIDADRQARISNKEKEYLRTVFISKIKNKEKLRYLLSSIDAHDILDSIG